jgi:arylsulfatase A-like enzyme
MNWTFTPEPIYSNPLKRALVLMMLLAGLVARAAEPATNRLNILFLLADDWAWPHASCLGCPGIKTPTFDRLAKEGVLFRNAHVAAPSCSPSRAAILTGQWHWRLKEGGNLWSFIPTEFPVYPDLLRKAGYFVGLTSKGYGPGNNQGRSHNAAGPAFKSFDAFLTARPKGQPFCYWFGSSHPHRSYPAGIGERSGVDPSKIVVPPYLPDSETTRSDICDYFHESQEFDSQCAAIIKSLEATGELDNTLIVMSGDNGWPFPRCKATCYDTGTHQPLAIRWGARVQGGRAVDDFVSLSDLAPTFLEAAGQSVPATMTARSLLPILLSNKSGQVDPTRDHTLTGMERHVTRGRSDGAEKNVGYPMRTLITKDFHYVRNFKPDRWPAGDPPTALLPATEKIAADTYAAFPDCDAGPTKAFVVSHRDEMGVKPFYERAFGKRPARELYDLRKDPYELKNIAEDPAYAGVVKELEARLLAELKATGDPRAMGGGDEFDRYPAARPGNNAK